MNILFTGVGRRDYVIKDFRDVINPLGGVVFALNSHPWSPALTVADHAIIAPVASDSSFPAFLINICKQHGITAVCTLIDTDMQVLSGMRGELERVGTRLILPSDDGIRVCRDKVKMNEWLTDLGLPCVSTFHNIEEAVEAVNAQQVKFPLIIKPRMGTGSISTYRVDDEEELRVFYKRAQKEIESSSVSHESGFTSSQALIIQEFILGNEYNLDVINDLNGSYKSTIVTEKLSVRSGEMDIAVTRNIPDLETLGRKIGSALGHPYLLDIDVVIRDGITYLLDMNPRISGSYPFGRMAGVNYVEILVRWLDDQNADVSSYMTPISNVTTMKGISMHIAQYQ